MYMFLVAQKLNEPMSPPGWTVSCQNVSMGDLSCYPLGANPWGIFALRDSDDNRSTEWPHRELQFEILHDMVTKTWKFLILMFDLLVTLTFDLDLRNFVRQTLLRSRVYMSILRTIALKLWSTERVEIWKNCNKKINKPMSPLGWTVSCQNVSMSDLSCYPLGANPWGISACERFRW